MKGFVEDNNFPTYIGNGRDVIIHAASRSVMARRRLHRRHLDGLMQLREITTLLLVRSYKRIHRMRRRNN